MGKFIKAESITEVTRGQGKEGMTNYCLLGRVSLQDDEKVLEMDNGGICTML